MVFSPVLLFLQFCVRKCIVLVVFGEVSERLNEPVSKTGVLFIEYRGFESRPLRSSLRFLLRCRYGGQAERQAVILTAI
jgi:hypothetical protein